MHNSEHKLSPRHRKNYLSPNLYQDKIDQLPKIYRNLKIPFNASIACRNGSPPANFKRNRNRLNTSVDGKFTSPRNHTRGNST